VIPNEAYGPKRLAQLLDVSERRVFELWESGELPSILIRETRRTTRQQLERYLAQRELLGMEGR
jgi:excisionase family DNA binding protein